MVSEVLLQMKLLDLKNSYQKTRRNSNKITQRKLKSSKEFFVEPCKFSVKMLPAKRRPFDVIADMTKRSISGNATFTNKKTKNKVKKGSAFDKKRHLEKRKK